MFNAAQEEDAEECIQQELRDLKQNTYKVRTDSVQKDLER